MIHSQGSNPFARIFTQLGAPSGISRRESSGGYSSSGTGDDLDTFRAELQQGLIAPNLFQPQPSEGQGRRLFAIG
jgi:hypothetical protein